MMDESGNGKAGAGPTRPEPVADHRLARLRRFTPARIALGRAGAGLPTAALLDLAEAQALARDAVHAEVDRDAVEAKLRGAGLEWTHAQSRANDRATYLRRPDLGRTLDADCAAKLARESHKPFDIVVVIADGLSARAVNDHGADTAIALVADLVPEFSMAPVVLAEQARVALGDPVGEAFRARLCIMLIGERPGMTAADSLGAYLTFAPRPGRTDAERNCVSNIRPGGLEPTNAAVKIAALARRALHLGLTGTRLKDDEDMLAVEAAKRVCEAGPA